MLLPGWRFLQEALTSAKLTTSGFSVKSLLVIAPGCAVRVLKPSGVSATLVCSLNQHSAPD